jgi:hypothetical protein
MVLRLYTLCFTGGYPLLYSSKPFALLADTLCLLLYTLCLLLYTLCLLLYTLCLLLYTPLPSRLSQQ